MSLVSVRKYPVTGLFLWMSGSSPGSGTVVVVMVVQSTEYREGGGDSGGGICGGDGL